jgi:hypothetical protein
VISDLSPQGTVKYLYIKEIPCWMSRCKEKAGETYIPHTNNVAWLDESAQQPQERNTQMKLTTHHTTLEEAVLTSFSFSFLVLFLYCLISFLSVRKFFGDGFICNFILQTSQWQSIGYDDKMLIILVL